MYQSRRVLTVIIGLESSDSKVIVIIIIIDNAITMTVIDFIVIVYRSNYKYNWLNCM